MKAVVHPSRSLPRLGDDEQRLTEAELQSGGFSRTRRRRREDLADDGEGESERRSQRTEGGRWSERSSSRHERGRQRDSSSSSASADPIRFLSSIRLEQQPAAAASSSSSSSRPPAPTAFVLLRSLPSSCEEAAVHAFCLPFHCRSHHFLPPASPPASTRDCLLEFSDSSWASQFVSIFSGKPMLRAAGHSLPVPMSFIPSRDAADMQRGERRGNEARDAADAEREREEGEVKEEDERLLAPALRRARLRAQYDFSSLSALTGPPSSTQSNSSVLVASRLPAAFSVTSSALSDVVRYALAPFAAVRFVHLQRLGDSGAVVALVVLHSQQEAEAVMQRKDAVRIMKEPVELRFAHRRLQPAQLTPPSTQSAAAAAPPSSAGPSLLSSLLSSATSAAADGAAVRPAHLPLSYVYQPETGCWSDSASALSFHPSSGLYYDANTALYYVWNAAAQQYAAVLPQTQQAAAPAAEAPGAAATVAASDASSVISAAPPAPSLLPLPTASTSAPIRLSLSTLSARSALNMKAARPALFATPEEAATAEQPEGELNQAEPHIAAATAASEPAASASAASGGAVSSQAAVSVDDLLASPLLEVSAARIACLLCQRGFANVEQLKRHVERSQLHASNLQLQQTQVQAAVVQPQQALAPSEGHRVGSQLQTADGGAAGRASAAAAAAAQGGSVQPAESGARDAALPAAARYYLALLEQSREQSSEPSEHRRPLLK